MALLFISILSILLSVFLYSQLRNYYELLYAVEPDLLALAAFEGVEQPKPAENLRTVVFYGDSHVAQSRPKQAGQ